MSAPDARGMTRHIADVIIVGAGPAGAATALLLARAGVDVLMLDRAAFPRPKPCGDCLSVGASAILRRLGVLDDVLAAPHAQLSGWRIVAPSGSSFTSGFDPAPVTSYEYDSAPARDPILRAISIERSVLDALLVRAALAAGARVERESVIDLVRNERGAVTGVRTRTGMRTALLIVGADGLRSVVAQRLGARRGTGTLRKLSLTYHVPVADTSGTGEMHVGDGICAGVAPLTPDWRCNLTIVADSARFGREVAENPGAFALTALAALPRLRGRVSSDAVLNAKPLASGPFDRPVRTIAFDGAVLIGDAAGYYDPFTGQGVHQALASAELLAPVIIDAVARRDARSHTFASYVAGRRSLVRPARVIQLAIEHILRRPALADRAIARISRAPEFGRALVAVTGDIAPARRIASPRALSSLISPQVPENAA